MFVYDIIVWHSCGTKISLCVYIKDQQTPQCLTWYTTPSIVIYHMLVL